MGLLLKENILPDIRMGVWKMDEDSSRLLVDYAHLFSDEDRLLIGSIKLERRKREKICTRILLSDILNSKVQVIYDDTGKPYLKDRTEQVSISHSAENACVVVSENFSVGVDTEMISPRILSIESRFMNPSESAKIPANQKIDYLFVYWCTKETITKMYGKKNLIFNKDIVVDPFILDNKGNIKASLCVDNEKKEYELSYFRLNNHIFVWSYCKQNLSCYTI